MIWNLLDVRPVIPQNMSLQCGVFDLQFHTEDGTVKCRCGENTDPELTDIGDAGNWPLFPLVSLRLGDTGSAIEYIYFRVGPLVCKQGMLYNYIYIWFIKDLIDFCNHIDFGHNHWSKRSTQKTKPIEIPFSDVIFKCLSEKNAPLSPMSTPLRIISQ